MNVTLEEKQVYGIVFAVKNSVLLNAYDLLAHFPALRRILGWTHFNLWHIITSHLCLSKSKFQLCHILRNYLNSIPAPLHSPAPPSKAVISYFSEHAY